MNTYKRDYPARCKTLCWARTGSGSDRPNTQLEYHDGPLFAVCGNHSY